MIGIIFNPSSQYRVKAYLKGSGIDPESVVLVNKQNYDDCKVIIRFGGKGVYSNHCYVKQSFSVPEVQVFDPAEKDASRRFKLEAEPFRHHWICKGLEKAKTIAKSGIPEQGIDILIRPTLKEIHDFLQKAALTLSCFDIESDPASGEITTFGVAYRCVLSGVIKSISIPLVEMSVNAPVNMWMPNDEVQVWRLVANYLKNHKGIVMQNFIFDTMMMSKYGIETSGPIYDTMIMQHLLDPEFKRFKSLGLEDLGREYLYIDPWKGIKDFRATESLWKYNARDAAYTLMIYENQKKELDNHEKRSELYERMSYPVGATCPSHV